MFWLAAGPVTTPPAAPLGVAGKYCPELSTYVSTCPFAGADDPTGTLCISVAFALDPQDPHVPFPNRQFNAEAVPLPNSLVGTNPLIRSAFAAADKST
jgi:hypothetical protein